MKNGPVSFYDTGFLLQKRDKNVTEYAFFWKWIQIYSDDTPKF